MSQQLQMFELSSKDIHIVIPATTRDEAFAKFFLKIKQGEISIDQIGCIVMSHEGKDEGDNVPFRTVPTLWLMELISNSTAFNTLDQMLDLDPNTDESATILVNSAKQDMWILDEIKKLEET